MHTNTNDGAFNERHLRFIDYRSKWMSLRCLHKISAKWSECVREQSTDGFIRLNEKTRTSRLWHRIRSSSFIWKTSCKNKDNRFPSLAVDERENLCTFWWKAGWEKKKSQSDDESKKIINSSDKNGEVSLPLGHLIMYLNVFTVHEKHAVNS